MSVYLLIGGCRDGELVNIPEDREYYKLAERPKVPEFDPYDCTQVLAQNYMTTTYRRLRFRGLHETFTVYSAHDPDETLEKLIQNYRAPDSMEDSDEPF